MSIMKKIFFAIFLTIFFIYSANAEVYCENNKFGLKVDDEKITDPVFTKLIRLKNDSYLFCFKSKYGIIKENGEILVEPKYSRAQRLLGHYAKLGKSGKYALYDETGDMILDEEYSSIELLFGRMFLVGKNYKYGLVSFDGDIIMAPVADDIYMPEKNTIKILYEGSWYTIEQKDKKIIDLPIDFFEYNAEEFSALKLIEQPITTTGYGIVSAGDYLIKIFSSISPAYEQTIDELIYDHGADSASILLKTSWLAKFPFVYTKNYFNTFKDPYNGPFSSAKTTLRRKLSQK